MAERPGKTRRQAMIARLLRDENIASQQALAERLAAQGCAATQATISRDLEELGAVRARAGDDGGLAYVLPGEGPSAPEAPLRRVLAEYVVGVEAAGSLVVLKTPPACAHLVAAALDQNLPEEIAGTIAGDDTVFVAVRDGVNSKTFAGRMRALAQLTN